jgi:hypothetical protein
MIKEIIIHVGFAKTGTSALQSFLHLNKERLLREFNVLYPGHHEAHHHLQTMASQSPEKLLQVRREGIVSEDDAQRFADAYRSSLIEELRNSTAERVVFSTEYLSGSSHEEKARVFGFLREFSPNVRIIAYLRDPWSFAISHVLQNIRDGLLSGDVSPGYANNNIETVREFEEASGIVPKVIPYIPSFQKIDIIARFLSLLNIERDDQFAEPSQDSANISLSYEAACLLAAFNATHPSTTESGLYKVDPPRDWASECLQANVNPATKAVLSKETAERIYRESFDHIQEIQDVYLDGSSVYWDAFAEMNFTDQSDTFSVTNLSPEYIVSNLFKCLYAQSERAVKLRAWVDHETEKLKKIGAYDD